MTVLALVACSAAGAEPAAPVAAGAPVAVPAAGAPVAVAPAVHPAGWKQLPAIATAVAGAARADGVVIDGADAWGEPAVGCYAVWLALHGGKAEATLLVRQVLDGLAARSVAIAISELATPSGPEGVLAFAFARAPYRGRVRAQLSAGRIAMTACFANQREPAACDAACTRVLQGGP
jgi:hypothetical protein